MKKVGLIKDTKIPEAVPWVDVKFTHALCIGQTGSGKTTSFVYPNLSRRLEIGHGVLFFDIKGSEHLAVKKLADDVGRLGDVVEIGKPWGAGINIMESFNNRTFHQLLISLVGDPAEGGSNTYFYNEALTLGAYIYQALRLKYILDKELSELDVFHTKKMEYFTLEEFFNIINSYEALYDFIQDMKSYSLELEDKIVSEAHHYNEEKTQELYKNIVLNSIYLRNTLNYFQKYDVQEANRNDKGSFDTSLYSVLSTLSGGFGFMAMPSARYLSQKENPLDVVEALQDSKIVIINVRVIPDVILELMLEQIFEKLIDLNLQSDEEKNPISIFIDEAQRLINKDIPLDVLRSSKVDVLMAVQSELQLVSKFKTREDWLQISVNIAQKFAFRSSYFGGEHLLSFYVDTATLETFEYAKEYDTKKYRAKPLFLNKKDLDKVEYRYQHKILKLKELKRDEILFYDVTHFENEREVVIVNLKTKKRKHKKLLSEYQNKLIFDEIKNYIKQPIEELQPRPDLPKRYLKMMYEEFGIDNQKKLDETFFGSFDTRNDLFSALYKIGAFIAENEDAPGMADTFYRFQSDDPDGIDINEDAYDDYIIKIYDKELEKEMIDGFHGSGVFITRDEKKYYLYLALKLEKVNENELLYLIDNLDIPPF